MTDPKAIAARLREMVETAYSDDDRRALSEAADAIERMEKALSELTTACEQDFCSDATESGFAAAPDDDSVMGGETSGELSPITFGMIRRARSALENLCEDCPPTGYPTDKTRCNKCPRTAIQPKAATND